MHTTCRQIVLFSAILTAVLLFYDQARLANNPIVIKQEMVLLNQSSVSLIDNVIDDEGMIHEGVLSDDGELEVEPPTLSGNVSGTQLESSLQFTKLHEEGWQQLRSTLLKENSERYQDRDLVEQICNQVGDEEDKWMCRRRGKRLALRFKKYYTDDAVVMLNRSGSERQFSDNPENSIGHIIVRIVNGSIHSFTPRWIGNTRNPFKFYDELILNRIVQVRERGGLHPNQTFDLVVLYGDACQSSNYNENHLASRFYPTVSYSFSKKKCPHRLVAPWIDMIQVWFYFF